MLPCLPSHVFNAAWSSKDAVVPVRTYGSTWVVLWLLFFRSAPSTFPNKQSTHQARPYRVNEYTIVCPGLQKCVFSCINACVFRALNSIPYSIYTGCIHETIHLTAYSMHAT